MAKIDETYMRNTFKIHPDVRAARINPYIAAASRRLQRMIDNSVYSSSDPDIAEIVKLAEGTLAMHYLTLNLNTSIRPEGLVKTEQVENNVTLAYLTPTEQDQQSRQYFEQAEELIREFLSPVEGVAPEFVEFEESFEASTRKWLT